MGLQKETFSVLFTSCKIRNVHDSASCAYEMNACYLRLFIRHVSEPTAPGEAEFGSVEVQYLKLPRHFKFGSYR
jgi:hypothetical protein